MEKTDCESYDGYVQAEESLLSGRTSPVIVSNDDNDLVSVSELLARADPTPTTATATAVPAADTYKRQISDAVPRDEHLNGPETTPVAAPPQQKASGIPRRPRGHI